MSRISIPTVEQSPAALREQIALAVADVNGCSYCLSAHAYLSRNAALQVLTNYTNQVAQTDVDFPVVQARAAENHAR